VRDRAEAAARVLGVGRDQHARCGAGDQDQPSSGFRWSERERGHDVAEADEQEGEVHHPPVGGTDRGQRADRVGHRVEVRLQPGGHRPPADEQDRSPDR
jgi:hypothetical protein